MLKNIIQSLFTKGTVALINLLVLILSSKYLGVSSRGEISIFILNISIVQVICGIYTGYSVVYFVPRFSLKRLLVDGLIFTLLFSFLCNSTLVFLQKQVPGYEWLAWLASVLVILNTYNCILLLGKQNIKMFNALSILQPLLLMLGIACFVLVFKVYTFEAYLFPLLISFGIAFLISGVGVLKYLRTSDSGAGNPYHLKPLLVNGFVFQAGLLMYIFSNRFSYYLLPGKATLGLFSSAVMLTESVLLIANGIAPVLLSKVANQRNNEQNAGISLALARLSFIMSAIGIVLILSIPELFYTSLLGKGFTGIKELMFLYAPGVLAISAFIPLTNYYSAIGRQKITLIAYALGFMATLISAPLLVTSYGVKGAALASNVSSACMTVFLLLFFAVENKITFAQFISVRGNFKVIKQLFLSK